MRTVRRDEVEGRDEVVLTSKLVGAEDLRAALEKMLAERDFLSGRAAASVASKEAAQRNAAGRGAGGEYAGGVSRGARRRRRIGSCAWTGADRARRGRGEARVRSDGSRVRGERVWQKARRGALFGFSDLEKAAGTTRRARPRV